MKMNEIEINHAPGSWKSHYMQICESSVEEADLLRVNLRAEKTCLVDFALGPAGSEIVVVSDFQVDGSDCVLSVPVRISAGSRIAARVIFQPPLERAAIVPPARVWIELRSPRDHYASWFRRRNAPPF
jgi:hypothetical protein